MFFVQGLINRKQNKIQDLNLDIVSQLHRADLHNHEHIVTIAKQIGLWKSEKKTN